MTPNYDIQVFKNENGSWTCHIRKNRIDGEWGGDWGATAPTALAAIKQASRHITD